MLYLCNIIEYLKQAIMKYHFVIIAFLLGCRLSSSAQSTWPSIVQPKTAETPVEVFCGVDLYYADVNYLRLYNTLVNLTPGVKWHMGNDWKLAAQAWVPLSNDGYADRYNMFRLSTFALSKEFHMPAYHQNVKLSAGLFGRERWGADAKWMMPVNSWLMLQAQAGLTRHYELGFGMEGESESAFDEVNESAPKGWIATGTLGARAFLRPWNTEFSLAGGRYLREDYGMELQVMRHFKNCTVLLFAQLHEKGNTQYSKHREAGGFRIIVNLDRKGWNLKTNDRIVTFRPAQAFRLTYNAQIDNVSMRSYTTDPEENERTLPMRVE